MTALPQQNRRSFYVFTPDLCSSYILIRPFGMQTLPLFSYCSGVFVNGTQAQMKIVVRGAELELSVLSFGAVLRAVCVGNVKRLSFSVLIDECDSQGVLIMVPIAMVKKWSGIGILRLIECVDVDPTLAFFAVASFYEVK